MYTAFQHCSGDSRHLTSFPTRRSSDLEHNRDRGRQIELARCGRIHAPILREPVVAHQQLCVVVLEKVQSAVTTTTPGFAAKDRKSTRLNSSHVEISYAVFCLKKKTKAPSTCARHGNESDRSSDGRRPCQIERRRRPS